MATAPSPNDLTRQQLDELDLLLQRMLSLPLNPADTPASAPMPEPPMPPSWRVDAPAQAPAAPHVRLADPPAPVALKFDAPAPTPSPAPPLATAPTLAPAPPVPVAVPPVPPTVTPIPTSATQPTLQAALAAKSVPVAPVPALKQTPAAPVPAPVVTPAPVSRSGLTPAPSVPPVPVVLLPLVALNAAFDNLCGLLGWPGRVLRSGLFKHLYGLTGLALLLYTVARIAQVQGWVTLPMPLPWPE